MPVMVFKTRVRLNQVSGGFDSHPPPPFTNCSGSMSGHIAQPPVNARLRATEDRNFWTGLVLVIAALILLLVGARHLTRINTIEGDNAWEAQLVKSFTCGGLQAKAAVAVPDLAAYEDPAARAAALEQMARERASAFPISYRIDTGAADPCPT